jgi:hypothetical protein
MTWRNNTCDVNYSPSLFTFLQIINSMKLTWFFLCFIIKMLDKRIIYTKYTSRLVVIRLFQLTRHDTNSCTYIMCIYLSSSSVVIVLLHKMKFLKFLKFGKKKSFFNFLENFDFFMYIVWVLLNERVTVISIIDFARECNMIFYCT